MSPVLIEILGKTDKILKSVSQLVVQSFCRVRTFAFFSYYAYTDEEERFAVVV